jgi:uncharacterized protein HemX
MKTFLKQVLAILVALIIFAVGGCTFLRMRFQSAYREMQEQQEAERKAEEQRRIQWNLDFVKDHEEMLKRPLPLPPKN